MNPQYTREFLRNLPKVELHRHLECSMRLSTLTELARDLGMEIAATESGIHSRDDVTKMRAGGVNAFLVGEAFMRAEDPGDALRKMFA